MVAGFVRTRDDGQTVIINASTLVTERRVVDPGQFATFDPLLALYRPPRSLTDAERQRFARE